MNLKSDIVTKNAVVSALCRPKPIQLYQRLYSEVCTLMLSVFLQQQGGGFWRGKTRSFNWCTYCIVLVFLTPFPKLQVATEISHQSIYYEIQDADQHP